MRNRKGVKVCFKSIGIGVRGSMIVELWCTWKLCSDIERIVEPSAVVMQSPQYTSVCTSRVGAVVKCVALN